jgi:putative PepSY-like beta-lactamase-inhibitor
MRRQMFTAAAMFGGLILFASLARADGKVDLDKVPAKIMSAIKGRFPDAQLKSVENENENGKVMYDIELTQNGRKYEMDIKEDGTIIEIEKGVAPKDFPAACAKAVAAKFPNAKIKEIMEVNKVEGKTETPQNYEVTLEEPGKKAFEAVVALDGSSVKEEKE